MATALQQIQSKCVHNFVDNYDCRTGRHVIYRSCTKCGAITGGEAFFSGNAPREVYNKGDWEEILEERRLAVAKAQSNRPVCQLDLFV